MSLKCDQSLLTVIKEGRDSQILRAVADLKAQWKKKGKGELRILCQNTKRDREESYFEVYYRNGLSRWFREIEMNCRAFVSINRMRAGHSSLKANVSRFNNVSTAECECGDGLQTERNIFWDCRLYEDQRATMRDILSESSKNSYRVLKARGKKISARRLLFYKQNS
jgi:hypothetical protein